MGRLGRRLDASERAAPCEPPQQRTAARQREAELSNQIAQTEAELRAAMDGLRDARTEAEEMRAYIERMHANG